MRTLAIITTATIATLFLGYKKNPRNNAQCVNPILGDISFVSRFGYEPDAKTDEVLRIRTHFKYVEKLLRQKSVTYLPADLQSKRKLLLDLLHNYCDAGIFPKNYDHAGQRKPCFIDRDGAICAVGYLVEQTAGRQVAEEINSKFQYEEIYAMNDPLVGNWILESGLTKEECAMIQPTYSPPAISSEQGIPSSILMGLNLSISTIDVIQISKGANSKVIPIVGLITGAGQIALGAALYPNDDFRWSSQNIYNGQRTLSMLNVGIGTSTMALSAWNLISNHKPKERSAHLKIFGYPATQNSIGLGFNLTKSF